MGRFLLFFVTLQHSFILHCGPLGFWGGFCIERRGYPAIKRHQFTNFRFQGRMYSYLISFWCKTRSKAHLFTILEIAPYQLIRL